MTPRTTSSIILSIILGTTTLLGVFFTLISFAHAQSQSNCHLITGSSQTPTGYASPISYFSNALMIKGDCEGSSIATQVGNGSTNTFIYNTSYRWSGTAWQTVALSGSQTQGAWIQGSAQAEFTSNRDTTFYVAYTCEWVNQAWKCGCLNASCTQNQWQLQVFQRPAAPPPTNTGGTGNTGGTTAGWQAFPNDSQQTLSHTQPLNSFNGANPQNLVDTYMDGRDNDVNNPGGGVNLNSAKLASSNQSSQFYPDATLATLGFKEAIKVNRNNSELTASYDGHTIGRYTSGGWNVNYPESLSNKPSGELGEATVKMLLKSNFRNQGSGWQYYATGGTSGEQGGGYTGGDSDVKVCFAGSGNVKNVSNSSGLSSALSGASCGDEIVLANGSYSGSYTLNRSCSSNNPIVVRAKEPLKAILTGNLTMAGSYGVLTNVTIRNGQVKVTGSNNRATRNYIDRGAMAFYVEKTARNTRIDHNEFHETYTPRGSCSGNDVVPCTDIFLNVRSDSSPLNTRIDHNYFRSRAGSEELGNSIYVSSFNVPGHTPTNTMVEYNLFENWNKKGALHIKSSGTTFRNNHLKGGSVRVDVRHSEDNAFIDNKMENTRQMMQIQGENNLMQGNYVRGTRMQLMVGSETPINREPVHNAVLRNNDGPLKIAELYSGQTGLMPGRNIRVINHYGDITKVSGTYDASTYSETKASSSQAPGRNLNLTTSQVGMSAPDNDCQ